MGSRESAGSKGKQGRRLVERIVSGDDAATEELYTWISRWLREPSRLSDIQQTEDDVHDVFLIVVQAIRNGQIRSPESLPGFINTVVRRRRLRHLIELRKNSEYESQDVADHAGTPEQRALAGEATTVMKKIMMGLSPAGREVLTRYYLLDQSPGIICAEMKLTPSQLRTLRNRARERFVKLWNRIALPR